MTETTARDLFAAGDDALTEAAFRTGDFTAAEELLREARARAASDSDRQTEASAIEQLGMLAHYQNINKLMTGGQVAGPEAEAEEELFRQSLAIRREIGDEPGTAGSLFGVGLVFQVLRSDWASAMPYFWQALGLTEALAGQGDLYTRSEVHRHLGFYFLVEDVRPTEALRHLQLSLELREELGDPRRTPSGLIALAQAELVAGNREQAVELIGRAVQMARDADLLPQRIAEAEQALREAEETLAQGAAAAGDGTDLAGGGPEAADTAAPDGETAATESASDSSTAS